MMLYLAGPLFNNAEREHGRLLRQAILPYLDVYLPPLDGSLLPELISHGMSPAQARAKIFADDIAAITKCDLFMIILNGRTVDEGAAFELGVAWSLRKRCFGYKDDFRQLTSFGDNPMIEESLEAVFHTVAELETCFSDIISKVSY